MQTSITTTLINLNELIYFHHVHDAGSPHSTIYHNNNYSSGMRSYVLLHFEGTILNRVYYSLTDNNLNTLV